MLPYCLAGPTFEMGSPFRLYQASCDSVPLAPVLYASTPLRETECPGLAVPVELGTDWARGAGSPRSSTFFQSNAWAISVSSRRNNRCPVEPGPGAKNAVAAGTMSRFCSLTELE